MIVHLLDLSLTEILALILTDCHSPRKIFLCPQQKGYEVLHMEAFAIYDIL